MRKAVIETLSSLADRDDRIVLLTGDLGFMALEPFAERHPRRFFNVGVAEQNMVGVSTGLAEAGFIPFVYSIATFATLRPYEFIRNGPILHRLPVRILGVGGGFEYGSAGPTHYGLEDIAVMRTQPGISVMAPVDYAQARSILTATWNMAGPVYYRLGKNDTWLAPGLDGAFEIGRVQWLRDGGDVVLLTLGAMAGEALAAADRLESAGRSCAVAVVASVRPAPRDDLRDIVSRFRVAVTVEAHYIDGGLGSLVAETAAESGSACRLVRCGVRQMPDGRSGSDAWMRELHGLTAARIGDAALAALA
jgi:transketolase